MAQQQRTLGDFGRELLLDILQKGQETSSKAEIVSIVQGAETAAKRAKPTKTAVEEGLNSLALYDPKKRRWVLKEAPTAAPAPDVNPYRTTVPPQSGSGTGATGDAPLEATPARQSGSRSASAVSDDPQPPDPPARCSFCRWKSSGNRGPLDQNCNRCDRLSHGGCFKKHSFEGACSICLDEENQSLLEGHFDVGNFVPIQHGFPFVHVSASQPALSSVSEAELEFAATAVQAANAADDVMLAFGDCSGCGNPLFRDEDTVECESCHEHCHTRCLVESAVRAEDCPLCVMAREPRGEYHPLATRSAAELATLKVTGRLLQPMSLFSRISDVKLRKNVLNDDDFARVRRMNGWIGSLAINHFLVRLSFAVGEERQIVLDTGVSKALFLIAESHRRVANERAMFEEGRERGVLWSSCVSDNTLERVLFPCNINESHWILLVAEVTTGVIHVYDSLMSYSGVPRSVTRIQHALAGFLSGMLSRSASFRDTVSEWPIVYPVIAVPQQTGTNCGAFMLGFIDRFLRRRPLSDVSEANMKDIRAYVLRSLQSSSVEDTFLAHVRLLPVSDAGRALFAAWICLRRVAPNLYHRILLPQFRVLPMSIAAYENGGGAEFVLRLVQLLWRAWLKRELLH